MLRVTIVNNTHIRIQIWLDGEPQVWVVYTPDQVTDLIQQLEAARDATNPPDQA
jgi:hypothetical protein